MAGLGRGKFVGKLAQLEHEEVAVAEGAEDEFFFIRKAGDITGSDYFAEDIELTADQNDPQVVRGARVEGDLVPRAELASVDPHRRIDAQRAEAGVWRGEQAEDIVALRLGESADPLGELDARVCRAEASNNAGVLIAKKPWRNRGKAEKLWRSASTGRNIRKRSRACPGRAGRRIRECSSTPRRRTEERLESVDKALKAGDSWPPLGQARPSPTKNKSNLESSRLASEKRHTRPQLETTRLSHPWNDRKLPHSNWKRPGGQADAGRSQRRTDKPVPADNGKTPVKERRLEPGN